MGDLDHLHKRLDKFEESRENDLKRLAQVEQALVGLSQLPAQIEKLGQNFEKLTEKFDNVIRLDERMHQASREREKIKDDVKSIRAKVEKTDVKLAMYAGGIAASMALVQVGLKFLL